MTRRPLLIGAGLLVLGLVLGTQVRDAASGDDVYQQLRKLEEAYAYITQSYVEDVDSARLVEDAIEGMLAGLDPHSTYISAEDMARVRENFDAEFEGVGIYYEFIEGPEGQDTLAVLMPITGGPSEEAGLLPGDRIIAIDDSTAIGIAPDAVQGKLKGPRGTQVSVEIRRPGFGQTLQFTITRDRIPLETVRAAYMMDPETGYIKLERFARTSHQEVAAALETLKGQGAQRLVLDLRDNPGGLVGEAVRIADEFLPAGDLVVYTEGRLDQVGRSYTATAGGSFETQPIIVLVNENSASASEILTGALQDHDRALIVGRQTFGKGLVQQQFGLSDGSVLQMTVSRYHTPTGRLIQTPYENGIDDEAYYTAKIELQQALRERLAQLGADGAVPSSDLADEVPDSLTYRTDSGRPVYGGGGIMPDFLVAADTVSLPLGIVISRGLDSEYARLLLSRLGNDFRQSWDGRQAEFTRSYRLEGDEFERFLAFAEERGVPVVDTAPDEQVEGEPVLVRADALAERAAIEARIRAYQARRLYGIDAFYPVIHQIDTTLRAAMRLWEPAGDLAMATR